MEVKSLYLVTPAQGAEHLGWVEEIPETYKKIQYRSVPGLWQNQDFPGTWEIYIPEGFTLRILSSEPWLALDDSAKDFLSGKWVMHSLMDEPENSKRK